jgi:thiol-disulfide isomerase/thioredoxin
MKKRTAFLLLLTISMHLYGQLPNGSIAPDFNVVDINGQPRHLYQMLEEGKIVLLEISATWCPPCWSYHNSQALQYFYNLHGPGGDNRARVLFIEGDPATNTDCLYGAPGCNDFSPGNWVSGTTYPYIDNSAIADSFAVGYYPTIFVICPNKKVYNAGQLDAAGLWEKAKTCPVRSGQHNAGIFDFDAGTSLYELCDTLTTTPSFTLINLGSNALTNATLQLEWNNTLLETRTWNGYLPTYGEAAIYFNTQALAGNGMLKTTITGIDNGATDADFSNNVQNTNFVPAAVFTKQQVLLKIRTDNYGAETYWELRDEVGNVLDHGGNENVGPNGGGMLTNAPPGFGAYGNNVLIKDTLHLPEGGCYSLHFVDYFGDGMCCEFNNGFYKLYNIDNPAIPILSGGEFGAYDDRGWGVMGAATATIAPADHFFVELYPNPAQDQVQLLFDLPAAATISVNLVDLLGHTNYALPAAQQPEGSVRLEIPMSELPDGLYFLQLNVDNQVFIRKVIHTRG